MNLYLNELAPWERKQEYFHNIQLGKDVRTQTTVLRKAIQDQTKVQLATGSSVVISQQRMQKGIDNISQNLQEFTSTVEKGLFSINEGLQGLQSAFEWGISEVVWQLEQNRVVLKEILEILMAPLDTQAKELKRRAEDAYANGWYDDALEDFLESEKINKYDFSVHISIGLINLFHLIDKKQSLKYFEKAIKYAKPKSPYHASYSLLYKALILRDMGQIKQAEECTTEAISLTPTLIEARYQNAQYNAILRNTEKAITVLKEILKKNICYCIKLDNDPTFNKIKTDVDKLLLKVKDQLRNECSRIFYKAKEIYSDFEKNIYNSMRDYPDFNSSFKKGYFEKYFNSIEECINNDSIIDCIEAKRLLFDINKIYNHKNKVIEQYKLFRSKLLEQKQSLQQKANKELRSYWGDNVDGKNVEITSIFIFPLFLIYFQIFALPVYGLMGWLSGQWDISFYISEIMIAILFPFWLMILNPYLNRKKIINREIKEKQTAEKEKIQVEKEIGSFEKCFSWIKWE